MIIVAAIILSSVALWELAKRRRRKQQALKKRKRQYFTELTKKQVLHNQHYSCAICKKRSKVWDYDHIDEDRSNNDLNNCQALCPNCHAIDNNKTPETENLFSSLADSGKSSCWHIIIFYYIGDNNVLLCQLHTLA
jgi:hypothetical protein